MEGQQSIEINGRAIVLSYDSIKQEMIYTLLHMALLSPDDVFNQDDNGAITLKKISELKEYVKCCITEIVIEKDGKYKMKFYNRVQALALLIRLLSPSEISEQNINLELPEELKGYFEGNS